MATITTMALESKFHEIDFLIFFELISQKKLMAGLADMDSSSWFDIRS